MPNEKFALSLEKGFVMKASLKKQGKYVDDGKNWMAIVRPSYGMSVDRQFLGYGNGDYLYDFSIVRAGNIIEMAFDRRVGGRYQNAVKSRDYVRNREFYVMETITENRAVLAGGFPTYDGILTYKEICEERRNEANEGFRSPVLP